MVLLGFFVLLHQGRILEREEYNVLKLLLKRDGITGPFQRPQGPKQRWRLLIRSAAQEVRTVPPTSWRIPGSVCLQPTTSHIRVTLLCARMELGFGLWTRGQQAFITDA